MAKKKAVTESNFESVKLRKAIVNKVRRNKNETGVPIATFFEMAAEEKLKR
jgi:hypothetical protein